MSSGIVVSFVTCVYNQNPQYFSECVASICSQTIPTEWIVVDDGSSPKAAEFQLSAVKAADSRAQTTYIRLPSNVGLSEARNAGIHAASGEWIIVLDSDDRAASGLAAMLTKLRSSIAIACFEVTYFSEAESEHRRLTYFEELFRQFAGSSLDPFLWFDFYYHGLIARRELLRRIGGYDPVLKVGEDQDILLRALEQLSEAEVAFVHEIGYEYRSNGAGICHTRWDEVLAGYTSSMLLGARRRDAPFDHCRFAETREIQGANTDCYEYRNISGNWVSWEGWYKNQKASKS